MNRHSIELDSMILDEETLVSLADLCRSCALPAEQILSMMEYGIIEPHELTSTATRWQFASTSIVRVQTVRRLQNDLGVNLEGAALALDLLDELKTLRQQLAALKRHIQAADNFYE